MFRLIQAFRSVFAPDLGRPVSPSTATGPATPEPLGDDDDVLIGVRGNVPIFIGGHKEALNRLKLRPIITRSHRHRQPHPAEQGPMGRATDRQDFPPPPPGQSARPRSEARGVLDSGWRPEREPYGWNPRRESQPDGQPETGVSEAEMAHLLNAGAGPGSFVRSPGPPPRGGDGRGS
jgi:hypothetical protein